MSLKESRLQAEVARVRALNDDLVEQRNELMDMRDELALLFIRLNAHSAQEKEGFTSLPTEGWEFAMRTANEFLDQQVESDCGHPVERTEKIRALRREAERGR